MASRINVTAKRAFPVEYKCNNCSTVNLDMTIVTGSASSVMGFTNKANEKAKDRAIEYANSMVEKSKNKLENKINNKRLDLLTCEGKCRKCKTIQPWASGNAKAQLNRAFSYTCIFLGLIWVVIGLVYSGLLGVFVAFLPWSISAGVAYLIFNVVSALVSKRIANKGTALMLSEGKEDYLPKLIVLNK